VKQPQTVVRRLLLTEKSTRLKDAENKYVFRVDPRANKLEIKRAVEVLFKVGVVRVNTLNRAGKQKRDRRMMKMGRTASWKRAVVTLKDGDKIELT
jgi:large subunit ribosomal protein L23